MLSVQDAWGSIVVRDLAMLVRSEKGSLAELRVPLRPGSEGAVPPADTHWRLQLSPGWRVVEIPDSSARTVAR